MSGSASGTKDEARVDAVCNSASHAVIIESQATHFGATLNEEDWPVVVRAVHRRVLWWLPPKFVHQRLCGSARSVLCMCQDRISLFITTSPQRNTSSPLML